jgi:hypothetical protein
MSESKKNSSQEDSKVGKKTKSAGEMSSELRKALETLRELMSQSDTQDADAQYRIGCVVRDVKGSSDKYGKSNVKRLARELGRDEKSLYDRAHVAETWGPEEDHFQGRADDTTPEGKRARERARERGSSTGLPARSFSRDDSERREPWPWKPSWSDSRRAVR